MTGDVGVAVARDAGRAIHLGIPGDHGDDLLIRRNANTTVAASRPSERQRRVDDDNERSAACALRARGANDVDVLAGMAGSSAA